MTKKCTFLYDKSPSFHDIASIPDFFEKPQIALLGSFPNDPKIWGLSVNDPKNWGLWNTRDTQQITRVLVTAQILGCNHSPSPQKKRIEKTHVVTLLHPEPRRLATPSGEGSKGSWKGRWFFVTPKLALKPKMCGCFYHPICSMYRIFTSI